MLDLHLPSLSLKMSVFNSHNSKSITSEKISLWISFWTLHFYVGVIKAFLCTCWQVTNDDKTFFVRKQHAAFGSIAIIRYEAQHLSEELENVIHRFDRPGCVSAGKPLTRGQIHYCAGFYIHKIQFNDISVYLGWNNGYPGMVLRENGFVISVLQGHLLS